jgi:hypothetical protein
MLKKWNQNAIEKLAQALHLNQIDGVYVCVAAY